MKRWTVALALALTTVATGTGSTAAASDDQAEPRVVYMVGDSITFGVGVDHRRRIVDRYPNQTKRLLGIPSSHYRAIGHGGQCLVATYCNYADPLVRTFGPEVLRADPKPTHVIVEIGINDLAHATSRQLRQSFRLLDERAKRRGVELYVGTVPPPGPALPWLAAWTEPQRQQLNDWIRTRWPMRHVDFDSALAGPRGGMRPAYDSGDGLHPNAAGAAAMAKVAAAALAR